MLFLSRLLAVSNGIEMEVQLGMSCMEEGKDSWRVGSPVSREAHRVLSIGTRELEL